MDRHTFMLKQYSEAQSRKRKEKLLWKLSQIQLSQLFKEGSL